VAKYGSPDITQKYKIGYVLHCHMQNFLSNPRRIHSGKKDKEKEEYGLL
jgi:hypothetical protein